MSQVENAVTFSSKTKRPYRKGSPLSPSERQRALVARKKDTHKEIRAYVQSELKDSFQDLCDAEGLTQSQMLEVLIKTAVQQSDYDVTE